MLVVGESLIVRRENFEKLTNVTSASPKVQSIRESIHLEGMQSKIIGYIVTSK